MILLVANVAAAEPAPDHVLDGTVLAVYRAETCGLSVLRAALASELSPDDLDGLEHGRLTFASIDDRIAYLAALERGKEGKHAAS